MRILRRHLLCAALGAGLGTTLGMVAPAQADTYPERTISIVVPFAAGGPTDTIARILADRLGAALGQSVIVENTAGASGSIGVSRVVHATPDGYTLGLGHIGTHVLNGAIYTLPYDLVTDLAPIGMVTSNPQLIVIRKGLPADTLKDFVAWLKANPDKASVGTAGVGSPSHVSAYYFQSRTGTHFQFVPYRGSGPVMQDLLAGQIDLTFDQAANSLPQVRAGAVRALAVTAKSRLAAAPDIPTVDEAGLPELYMSVWHGLWAPKATPRPVLARLSAAVLDALKDAKLRARFAELGQDIPAPEQQTPDGLAAFQRAEIAKWWPIIKAAGIRGE